MSDFVYLLGEDYQNKEPQDERDSDGKQPDKIEVPRGIWRDKGTLVVDLNDYEFDNRCVVTNDESDGKWTSVSLTVRPDIVWFLVLLLLFGVMTYIWPTQANIVNLVFSGLAVFIYFQSRQGLEDTKVRVALCPSLRTGRAVFLFIGNLLFFGGFFGALMLAFAFFGAMVVSEGKGTLPNVYFDIMSALPFVAIFGAAVNAVFNRPVLKIVERNGNVIWLKGAGAEFLSTLPRFDPITRKQLMVRERQSI